MRYIESIAAVPMHAKTLELSIRHGHVVDDKRSCGLAWRAIMSSFARPATR